MKDEFLVITACILCFAMGVFGGVQLEKIDLTEKIANGQVKIHIITTIGVTTNYSGTIVYEK